MTVVSTDKKKLNLQMIHSFLTQSYWASGVSIENVAKRIQHAICYGVYKNDIQVGFARVITDQASFAYIADLFIVDHERGNGYSKQLMNSICFDERLSDVKNWYLITKDAQTLYHKSGFKKFNKPNREIMYCTNEDLTNIDIQ